jgi:putative ABC transport system substrate-binding protein
LIFDRISSAGRLQAPDAASVPTGQRLADRLVVETQAAGSRIGVDVSAHIAGRATELPQAFAQMKRNGVQAVIVQQGALTFPAPRRNCGHVIAWRLPAMYEGRDFVDAGGLVSYGSDVRESYRRAAGYVDRIFKGANPGDLAIEQPTKFELV